MEIGTEISRKIRTAIKGKLQELGAYVDEELPDYIMVMVANKKSQEQMTDDLSLFLGNNTLRFTTWLQGVLDKLRAVTPGSNSLKASEAIIFNSSMPPLKSQSREDRAPQPQQQEKFFSGGASSSQAHHSSDRTSSDASVAARLMSTVKPLQESSPSEDIIDIKLDMDDAFNDDLSFSSESSSNPRKKSVDLSSSRTQRPTAQVYRPPGSTHRLEEHGAIHRLSQSGPITARQSSFQGSRAATKYYEFQEACRAEENRSAVGAHRALQELDQSRKRKIPVASSVVKVKKFMEEFEDEEEEEEEDEEEYISHTAGLPSSVSVPSRPERRPTLPPSKQANKNLILKAISEAQESITRTTAYSTVPQKQMVPVAPRARPVPEEELILMKSRASMLRYQEEPKAAPMLESRQANKHRMDILSRLHPEKPMEETEAWAQADERRRDILSRLHPEPRVEETSPWEQDVEGTQNVHPMDSRSFIMKSPKVSKTPPMQTPPMQTPPTTDATQQLGRLFQPRENIIPEKPASPKFIVTLDGVPSPSGYPCDEDMEVEPSYTDEGGLYTEPNNMLSTPEHSQLMQMNSQDVHTFTAANSAAPAKAKIHERCKYWPACKNAEQCAYHHPTTVCKAFPKCRFAEKCFFIHPNCKFDAKCTKADCPYTHASRRNAPPPVKQEPNAKSHMKVQCRYFPSCKNTECPFFHPKHCRFSSQCTRPDCEFYHPSTSLPPRHALTWTRSQACD